MMEMAEKVRHVDKQLTVDPGGPNIANMQLTVQPGGPNIDHMQLTVDPGGPNIDNMPLPTIQRKHPAVALAPV